MLSRLDGSQNRLVLPPLSHIEWLKCAPLPNAWNKIVQERLLWNIITDEFEYIVHWNVVDWFEPYWWPNPFRWTKGHFTCSSNGLDMKLACIPYSDAVSFNASLIKNGQSPPIMQLREMTLICFGIVIVPSKLNINLPSRLNRSHYGDYMILQNLIFPKLVGS